MTAITSAAAIGALQGQTPANGLKGKTAADAAKQFEQLLAFELLKTMRATVPESDDGESGFASDTLESMFDQAVAESSAGRLGLAPMLERQLDPNAAQRRAIPEEENSLASPLPPVPAEGRHPHPHPAPGTTFGGALPLPGDLPVQGRMSSDFGWRTHPISGEKKFHGGMDIAAPTGTEIRAAQRGLVTFAGNRPGYGNVVEIRHPDGTTGRYAHASRLHVEAGDKIDVGETIADVGATGEVTGPHLHFEVRKNGHPIDPERWLDKQRESSDDLDPSRTGIAIE